MNFVFRLMMEVPDAATAETELGIIAPQIEACATIEKHAIQQYWKIPVYQEVTLYLRPSVSADIAYQCLTTHSKSGWVHSGDSDDRWSVWNPNSEEVLLSLCVKWAHLELSKATYSGKPDAAFRR